VNDIGLSDLVAAFEAGGASGKDPAYEDVFLQLKEEVGRLSGIDDVKIVRGAEHVLTRIGKDLRAAGYFAFGRLRQSGGGGLGDGIELVSALVEHYGDAIYPRRAEARKVAVEWLSSGRMLDELSNGPPLSLADIDRADAAVRALLQATSSWPEQGRPRLEPLVTRLAAARSAHASPLPRNAAPATSTVSAPLVSLRDVLEQARGLASYFRDQEGGALAATRLLLGVRWNPLSETPPADGQGRTRLAAPRGEVRRQVERLAAQAKWPELAACVDGAFMEAANHLWLDLARYRDLAVGYAYADAPSLRDALRADLRLLLERLPELARLAFDDGTPFMDEATRAWVETEVASTHAHAEVQRVADGHRQHAIDEEAAARLAAEGLPAACAWLRTASDHGDARERFLRRWCLARLFDRAGHSEAARHLLEALDGESKRFGLAEWEPALCFEVKQHLLRHVRDGLRRKSADKVVLSTLADRLGAELALIDPLRALDLA
jgi:type VI secretion system protein VasJ